MILDICKKNSIYPKIFYCPSIFDGFRLSDTLQSLKQGVVITNESGCTKEKGRIAQFKLQ